MYKILIFFIFFLNGCVHNTSVENTKSISKIAYSPMEKSILKEPKPYVPYIEPKSKREECLELAHPDKNKKYNRSQWLIDNSHIDQSEEYSVSQWVIDNIVCDLQNK